MKRKIFSCQTTILYAAFHMIVAWILGGTVAWFILKPNGMLSTLYSLYPLLFEAPLWILLRLIEINIGFAFVVVVVGTAIGNWLLDRVFGETGIMYAKRR